MRGIARRQKLRRDLKDLISAACVEGEKGVPLRQDRV